MVERRDAIPASGSAGRAEPPEALGMELGTWYWGGAEFVKGAAAVGETVVAS